ncbi:uncharacterized protein EV420DRAFT_1481420 [Desarmillaria tabescens]|uniref:Uncharacterized protein n=1 Tax=Armillaria tabescens TaxID=1929756 RepID=A0AA39N2P4_ARMTA|nr:uncharacterized protein EV420DRAFT_1481420 [Desarmillaria tabescens]KAK0455164.1 hypothetical protein EV420DRAFT_1481420 [Desarmillaria tabescens]
MCHRHLPLSALKIHTVEISESQHPIPPLASTLSRLTRPTLPFSFRRLHPSRMSASIVAAMRPKLRDLVGFIFEDFDRRERGDIADGRVTMKAAVRVCAIPEHIIHGSGSIGRTRRQAVGQDSDRRDEEGRMLEYMPKEEEATRTHQMILTRITDQRKDDKGDYGCGGKLPQFSSGLPHLLQVASHSLSDVQANIAQSYTPHSASCLPSQSMFTSVLSTVVNVMVDVVYRDGGPRLHALLERNQEMHTRALSTSVCSSPLLSVLSAPSCTQIHAIEISELAVHASPNRMPDACRFSLQVDPARHSSKLPPSLI